MQIALCHENVLPHRGGAEMYVADLARRLTAAGHDVHLYAAQWDSVSLPTTMTIHPLPKPRGMRWSRPWQFSAILGATLARDRPQISIGFDKVLGTEVYYPLGGLQIASAVHNRFKHRLRWQRKLASAIQSFDLAQQSFLRLERQLINGPGRPLLVANSKLVRRHMVDHYSIEPATIPVIHNAIDPNRFKENDRPLMRSAMRRQWDLTPHDVVGAMIAMNYRLKGLDPLLRSLALLPDDSPFRLLIAGSPKTHDWEKLANRLGVAKRVRFIGHCEDIRRVLFAADLLIHPTFYDPCSLVVLEALACGLPVITTKNNGASELFSADAGSIIDDPHDLNAMAHTMIQWIESDRRRIGSQAARAAAARWTFDQHVRAMEQALAGVVDQRLKTAS
jgi:UDP-glucose:(heptosyl)LPS alpha-1,3-glucosyltransferase